MLRIAAAALALSLLLPAASFAAPMYSYRGVVPCRDGIEALGRVLGPHNKYEDWFIGEEFEWNFGQDRDYKAIVAFVEDAIVQIDLILHQPMSQQEAQGRFGPPSATGQKKETFYFYYYPGGVKPSGGGAYMFLPFRGGLAGSVNITCD